MKETLNIYNCKEVSPGDLRLYSETSIMCWEGDHDFYAKIIASIVLGIWIVLLPFLCLYFLLKNRQDLETKENLETMGFIYIGLQKKCF